MAILIKKKTEYITAAATFAAQLLVLTRTGEELAAYQLANTFQAAGVTAIADADCVDDNAYLTATIVNAVVTIAGQLGTAVTPTMRNTLRQASSKPTP